MTATWKQRGWKPFGIIIGALIGGFRARVPGFQAMIDSTKGASDIFQAGACDHDRF